MRKIFWWLIKGIFVKKIFFLCYVSEKEYILNFAINKCIDKEGISFPQTPMNKDLPKLLKHWRRKKIFRSNIGKERSSQVIETSMKKEHISLKCQ